MDYKEKYEMGLEGIQEILGSGEDSIKMSRLQLRLQGIFPELKESEDERIKKELIAYHRSMAAAMNGNRPCVHEAWIAWLEKQGERKPVNDTDEDIVEAVKDTSILDLVEPKFHEGEWVVQEKIGVYKVIEVCESWYEVVDNKDKHYSIGFDKEYMCHLWTIQDAKDGDVLVEDSCIFIIQKLGDNSTAAKTYCTLYNDGDFDDGSILYFDVDSTKPATKEQRDTLMKAMADAGWEFDFEKKELKKIEQKPTWSEEDSFRTETLISVIKSGGSIRPELRNEFVNWLKSLKDRIGG